MKLFSSIKESVAHLTNKFVQKILTKVNARFIRKEKPFQTIARSILRKYLLQQPEVRALMNGTDKSLAYELGIVDPSSRMLNIIDTLVQSVIVDFTPFTAGADKVRGRIQIRSVNVDYQRLINMPDAIVVTEKGEELYWLEWLLFAGRGIIIQDYRVQFGHFGRTGGAHMVEGDGWGVPSQYAGEVDDNFVTRAIAQMRPELEEAINNV